MKTEPDTYRFTTGRTKHHQCSDADFGGTSHGSVSKNTPAWPLVLGVRAETLRQNRRQHQLSLPSSSAAESTHVLDLLLINSVLEADYLSADNAVSASLHLMQK